MRSATDPAARFVPITDARLPDWCDAYLDPPGAGDFFGSRAWYDTVLEAAMPRGAQPVLAVAGGTMLPLLRQGGRLRSLVTPYTLRWGPLHARGSDAAARQDSARALGRLLRGHRPIMFEALDPDAMGLASLLDGLRGAGLSLGRFRQFAHWHAALVPGDGWEGFLAARPPPLRTTIRRRLARTQRFTLLTQPGAALDAGIADYGAVIAGSWKPAEPSPRFDPALMRAAASVGALRLGILRQEDGAPIAAQYWVVSEGRAHLLKLAHDERARSASPGTALTALMIRALFAEGGITALDFGRGDDAYKALWVSERDERFGLMLTDPWQPACWPEMARQVAGRARRWLRGDAARVAVRLS